MEVPLQRKELVGLEYPGIVINNDKMMQQLGGEKKVFDILKNPSKRMELYFRPADPYSKPIYGDKFPTNSLIIEVVRKRKIRRGSEEPAEESYSVDFIGFVNSVFKFKSLCDFQILPALYKEDGSAESLIPKLVPTGLLPASWLQEDVPLFITPLLYSRFECVQNFYTDGVKHQGKSVDLDTVKTVGGTSRKKRISYAVYKTFEDSSSCDGPCEKLLKMLPLYPLQVTLKAKIAEFYQERPIWSKAAILNLLNCENQNVNYALTANAYRFSSGPWRTLWVKFGYDPRKDPASKIYQLLDFRVKSSIKLGYIDPSRVRDFDDYSLPVKSQKLSSKASLLNAEHLLQKESSSKEHPKKFPSYVLLEGQLPAMRQCYYQLCDIHIKEVQKLVHQNDGMEQLCHEKDGWCELGVIEKCREVISARIEELSWQLQQKP